MNTYTYKLLPNIFSQRIIKKSSPQFQALYRIVESPEKFNNWKEKHRLNYLDLSFIEFHNLNLSDINFIAVKLKNARFININFENAVFKGSNLNNAIFVDCNLKRANFKQARLVQADFSSQDMNFTNLFETLRDSWIVTNVICSNCWIEKDMENSFNSPDKFEVGEFEVIYGHKRIKIFFPNGMQPIDLLALPFHAQRIIDNFSNDNLVFSGLSTIGEQGLEFKIEPRLCSDNLTNNIQNYFDKEALVIRLQLKDTINLLTQKDKIIEQQNFIIDNMKSLVNHRNKNNIFIKGNNNIIAQDIDDVDNLKINE